MMLNLMPEAYVALMGVATLAGWVVWRIVLFTDEQFADARALKAAEAQRRLALRENINQLIVELSYNGDHSEVLLRQALEASIVEYRSL